jgi:insertion element IS1 protein InsB
MECKYCGKACIKWGQQKTGRQRYYCNGCNRTQQAAYSSSGCAKNINRQIGQLVCESVGIRGIGRVLCIAVSTVLRKIKQIAAGMAKPPIPLNRPAFEMDELRTYIKHKGNEPCLPAGRYWIAYAICPEDKQVVDFVVGKRSKRTLKMVVNTLLLSGVGLIKTDKLNIYGSLIPAKRHCQAIYGTNHIERHNLNLRTHLKRLGPPTSWGQAAAPSALVTNLLARGMCKNLLFGTGIYALKA